VFGSGRSENSQDKDVDAGNIIISEADGRGIANLQEPGDEQKNLKRSMESL